MLLDIFKLYPSELSDVATRCFHPTEKHKCHQSVEKVSLRSE